MFGKTFRLALLAGAVIGTAMSGTARAGVSAEEAAQLNSTLTPFGAERAGNKDHTIPAWDGGYDASKGSFITDGMRGDPFAGDKVLFSINAQNMDRYADKLSDGVKAMLKKYPQTYHLDVYPTRRTAKAPQWVYNNIYANATHARLEDNAAGGMPQGAIGGVPFPIPKNGLEAMWNHLLRWRGTAWFFSFTEWLVSSDGSKTLIADINADVQSPYYFPGAKAGSTNNYWNVRGIDSGPPLRAGEAITARMNLDEDRTNNWVYLPGQRRVRKLPNACCDTPSPFTAGVMSFDETEVFTGRLDRFDWKLVGKKELYIPYNSNRTNQPDDPRTLLGAHHLDPRYVRWELHRVWVVDATLAEGKRHQYPRARYYLDEDTWNGVLSDRWDPNNQLAHTMWALPMVWPDLPGTFSLANGFYDLISGTWFVNNLLNGKKPQYTFRAPVSDIIFTPDSMAGSGVR